MSKASIETDIRDYGLSYHQEEKMVKFFEKENTHIVFKREDILKYLTEVEYQTLEELQNTIIRGRARDGKKTINNYYICNKDEPYAEVVHGVIIGGEAVKAKQTN